MLDAHCFILMYGCNQLLILSPPPFPPAHPQPHPHPKPPDTVSVPSRPEQMGAPLYASCPRFLPFHHHMLTLECSLCV